MVEYVLEETEEFKKEFGKLPKAIKKQFNRQMIRVRQNPLCIGKPLSNKYNRELKNSGYRAYYYIEQASLTITFTGISKKKDQKRKISELLRKLYILVNTVWWPE